MIKFKKIEFKNFLSAGDKGLEFNLNDSGSTLLLGSNGSGKCLDHSTKISICINNNITKEKFIKFIQDNEKNNT